MKIDVSIEFFEHWAPQMIEAFIRADELMCKEKHGKVEISYNDGIVTMVSPLYHAKLERKNNH
jgi:hypothetical protein